MELKRFILLTLSLFLMGDVAYCGKSKTLDPDASQPTSSRYLGVFPGAKRGIEFLEHIVEGDGDCAFTVLGVTRGQLVADLWPLRKDSDAREYLAPEIRHAFLASEISARQMPASWAPLHQAYEEAWSHLEEVMSAVKAEIEAPYPEALELGGRVSWLLENTRARGIRQNLSAAYDGYEDVNTCLDLYFRTKKIFRNYLNLYLPPNHLWMGCNTALLWARQKGFDLHIWRESDKREGVLSLVDRIKTTASQHPIHMLHTSGFIHFNLLEVIAERNLSLERRQIRRWNKTEAELPSELTLFDLFAQQARAHPDAIGVVSPVRTLTYEEIYLRSNRVGRALLENGAKPNRLIGIFMSKSWEQVVGCLGVLAAGAAFLPVDPEWPDKRISKVLTSGKVRLLLTQQHLTDRLQGSELLSSYQAFPVDSDEVWASYSDTPIPIPQSSENTAYVIFTSGSTGEPKGVVIDHVGAVNTILDINRKFEITAEDRVFGLSKLTFDLSIYDIFGLLAAGGAIVYPDVLEAKNPSSWVSHIVNDGVTIWNSVPMLMGMLVEYAASPRCVEDLRRTLRLTLLSGDWIPLDLPERISGLFTGSEVISLGGATEASIWSIIYPILEMDRTWKSIPYGLPMVNQKMYVLDHNLEHCPMGVRGDIYIGGTGVAKGYWRDKKRTRDRFIVHPKTRERLYKTGDLGRWNSTGYMEFLGREDNQVKIGGFRIELGDVEDVLSQHPGVKHSIAAVTEVGHDQRLVAYVIPDREFLEGLDERHLMDWQEVYEGIYEEPLTDLTTNFSGWISSYTGKAIPTVEMEEWLYHTVQRILVHKPKRVLEIGCGSGLLMSRIGPLCDKYTATDISLNAIGLLGRMKEAHPELSHVKTLHRPAHDFSGFDRPNFDFIILNSVVQYFPHANYLEGVIKNAIRLLSPGGVLFVGDVRNHSLLREFHASVANSKYSATPPRESLATHVQSRIEREEELVISPQFFYELRNRIPEIQHVRTQLKAGQYKNELNSFRFDAELIKEGGRGHSVFPKSLMWEEIKGRWYEEILVWKDELDAHSGALTIRGIPNARLAEERALLEWLYDNGYESLASHDRVDVAPHDFFQPAEKLGLRIELAPHEKDLYLFDVTFVYTPPDTEPPLVENEREVSSGSGELTNYPILVRNRAFVTSSLLEHCEARLPPYMLPSSYTFIDRLPLSSNGKVDRKSLPSPSKHRQEEHEEPTDSLDRRVARLWGEILGVSSIGMQDDFFELGGNSLLAVQVLVRGNEIFGTDLPVSALFANSTLKGFCSLFAKEGKQENRSFMGFNTEGARTPIFFVHSGRGGAEAYVDLAHNFDEEQPIYAINSYNLINSAPFLTSIEAMAREYLTSVRELQPTGPYFLGGWSLGGVVAYEMSQQLQLQGEEVRALYFLDAILFTGFECKQLRSRVKNFTKRDPFYSALPSPYREHVQEVDCVQTNALLEYKAEPYAGNVILIKPEEYWSYLDLTPDYNGNWAVRKFMHRAFSKKYNGWEKLIPSLQVHPVTGNHLTIMEGEHAARMANIIQADCRERPEGRRPEGWVL